MRTRNCERAYSLLASYRIMQRTQTFKFEYLRMLKTHFMHLCLSTLDFRKKFLDDTYFFTLFVLLRPSDNTTSQNIGGTNAWAVPPPQILGGPSPQSPLGLHPCGPGTL